MNTLLVADLLRAVFSYEGIEFKSCIFLRWRLSDDRVIPRPIQTITDLLTELVDGSYQLTISEVTISRIEKEPLTVPEITIEVSCENSQWSEPRIYPPGYEDFGPEHDNPQALQARLEKIRAVFKLVLPYITLAAQIAKTVRTFFQ